MSPIKYPRGSEWRRWDLQVHTPYSALNNGFGNDFPTYVQRLLKEAVAKGTSVIGVTDYFSIDGYRHLKSILDDRRQLDPLVGEELANKAREILFLPNIELRTSVLIRRPDGTDSRVNFHVLFSDDVDCNDIEDHFFRELKFTAESNPGGRDEKWSLTDQNLEELGRKLKEQHPNFGSKSDLFVGMMNAVVQHEDVTETVERQASRFKEKVLFLLPADEDLSECNWNGQGHLMRKVLLQKAHIVLSGNSNTREFCLGKKHASVESFLEEFKSRKPMIRTSDAHDYESLFQRFTWLKADPTFKGLCEVLNEPEDRVSISTMPESCERVAARPTRVIESAKIAKRAGSTLEETWFDCDIPLNPELVAIIGNKGNGKSALADS